MDAEYLQQLNVVEQALSATINDSDRVELEALKSNLIELIQLTQQTTSPGKSDGDALDTEINSFMAEIGQLDSDKDEQAQLATSEEQLEVLRAKFSKMLGEKCSAPHEHSWGSVSYHNAIVSGIEDEVDVDSNGVLDVRLRVLFTNPTHKEMLPCTYYLNGECRFDDVRCHYSHGEVVSGATLREYQAPDFERLAQNCIVLAKLEDRLWHRGRVLCLNFVEQQCRVRLDGRGHKERERDFAFEELFPIYNDDELSNDETSSSGSNSDSDSEDLDDIEIARRARLVEQSLFTFKPTQPLGEWEKYTKGIGSKLMAQMGYIHGTGLGSDGRGIVIPVSAQVLPPGRSLDACMELREAANGDKDLFSVEKKLRQAQKKQEAKNEKAYARESQRVDVFSFLNTTVFNQDEAVSTKSGKDNKKPADLSQQTTKSLNVESVRLADDIRRKEREIAQMEKSVSRNASSSEVYKRLASQLAAKRDELVELERREKSLTKEQHTRKTKSKLTVF